MVAAMISLETWRGLFGGGLFDRAAWRGLTACFRDDRWTLLLYVVVASAQSLLVLPSLWLVRMVFDVAIPSGRIELLLWIGAGLLAFRLLNSAILLGLRALILRIIKRAMAALRSDLLRTLYGLSWEFYANSDTSRLHTRIVQDSERVDAMSNALLSVLMPAVFSGLSLALVLLWLNWWLLLLATSVLPLAWLAGSLTGRFVKRRVLTFQRAYEAYSRGVQFVLRYLDLTRLVGFEAGELDRQSGLVQALRRDSEAMAMSYAVHNQVQANVTGLAGLVILIAGGTAIAQHSMSLGAFLAFYVAAGMLNGFVERIGNTLPDLIAGNESLMTLLRLRASGPPEPYHGTRRIGFGGRIALRHVGFGFAGRTVLREVSLEIEADANIAITGPNGAGKTTILLLIVGFCRPQSGAVLAEDVPYDALDLPALRRGIGVVMQRPLLFAGSIAENIGYGHADISRADIIAAARLALAHDFVAALPNGYDTEIGEAGARLSGGEIQRLAIARALVGRPRLLILDEPTNHIDADTVARLMRGLIEQPGRPAILTISHDDEVVRWASRIYRLDQGVLTPASQGAPQGAVV